MSKITIYTDFDNTLVEQSSLIKFIKKYIVKHPLKFLHCIANLINGRYGFGGRALTYIVNSIDKKSKLNWFSDIADELNFNYKWLFEFKKILNQHKEKKIDLVLITRNDYLIPEFFMKKNFEFLKDYTNKQLEKYTIIGNNSMKESVIEKEDGEKIKIHYNINKVSNKDLFIASKHAHYFGDKTEKRLLMDKKLKNLDFVEI